VIVPGRWLASAILILAAAPALAQNCPAPLAQARRLVLVTSETMNAAEATLRLYERAAPGNPWRALGRPEPAVIGKSGMAWSHFFRRLARRGEPIKVDRDKRAPAGVYSIGRSFGTLASSRPGHLHVTGDTICVDDPSSPAYNTITSRRRVGPLSEDARAQGPAVLGVVDRAIEAGFLPAAPRPRACGICDFRDVCGPLEETRITRKDQVRLDPLHVLRDWP
jgi:L,D-peptidoglycan transpeptidase YkuD (ErfK/YbiS/YcfS/YnhG family)